jgi:muconolactone delta-isomerase
LSQKIRIIDGFTCSRKPCYYEKHSESIGGDEPPSHCLAKESNMQYLVMISRSENASSMSLRQEDIEAEAEHVRRLYAAGIVRQIWLRAEGGACMISEADDENGLRQLLVELPLVRSGYLAQPQISQLRSYAGFGPRSY